MVRLIENMRPGRPAFFRLRPVSKTHSPAVLEGEYMELKKKNLVFLGLVLIVLVAYVVWSTGWNNILLLIQQANGLWILGGVAMIVCYWLLEALILHSVVVCYCKSHRFGDTFATTMIGQLFNNLTPSATGGQPVQAYHMTKTGLPLGVAMGSLIVRFILYQIALTLYSAVVLILRWNYFSSLVSGFGYLVFVGFLINTAVMLFLLSVCFFRKFTHKIAVGLISLLAKIRIIKNKEKTIAYIEGELASFHEGFSMLHRHIGMMCSSMVLSLLQLTAFFLIPYFLFRAFHVTALTPGLVVCAQAFVTMISSFVPLPGASGGAEYSFYTFFSPFCPDRGVVNLIMLLWRMITFYLPIGVGLCYFSSALHKIRHKEKAEPKPQGQRPA